MPRNLKLLLLIVGVVVLEVFTFGQAKDRRLTVTEKDGQFTDRDIDVGPIIAATKGDTLIVKLPVTPSNGEFWQVVTLPEGLQEAEKTRYELLEQPMPGAKGVQVFQFVIETSGRYILLFTRERGKGGLRAVCTLKIIAKE